MDNTIEIERHVPDAEHILRDLVADLLRRAGFKERHHAGAFQPAHRQQSVTRHICTIVRQAHTGLVTQHMLIECQVRRLAPIVQLLTQAFRQLAIDITGRYCRVIPLIELEDQPQLAQIRVNGRCHVGILKFHRQQVTVQILRLMNLAKRGCGYRLTREGFQPLLPVRAKFCRHPATGEQPSHRRGISLQAGQLFCIFGWQCIRNCRQNLCDLHDRAFQPAKRIPQIGSMLGTINLDPQIALARHARGKPCHRTGYAGIAANPATNTSAVTTILLSHQDNPSSSSIMPEIISSPIDQNAGSRGSSPKRCRAISYRSVPPACSRLR